LESLIESCDIENKISEDDELKMIEELKKFSESFITNAKNGLGSAMLSYGYQKSAITTECQNNLVSLLNQVKVNALDKLNIRIEDRNNLIEKGRGKIQEDQYLPLENDQVNVLCLLVEAYRNIEPQKRVEFIVTRGSNSDLVLHPGFNKGWTDISIVDLRMLDSVGLVKILEQDDPHAEFKFILTPNGLKYFELIKQKEIEPIKRVEKDILQFIELETFKSKYGNAYKKWKEAETLLWKADNNELYSAIGHLCREAVQEFLDKLIIDNNLQNEFSDKTKTKNRLEGILQKNRDQLGKTLPGFYTSLLSYWNALVDLIQRQEHSGLNEGEEISFNDAKRIVFQTAVLFYDISKRI
jgi:hypothetical protein